MALSGRRKPKLLLMGLVGCARSDMPERTQLQLTSRVHDGITAYNGVVKMKGDSRAPPTLVSWFLLTVMCMSIGSKLCANLLPSPKPRCSRWTWTPAGLGEPGCGSSAAIDLCSSSVLSYIPSWLQNLPGTVFPEASSYTQLVSTTSCSTGFLRKHCLFC